MDGQRFDLMARMMAGGLSRRAALRGLAAGLAGAAGLRAGGAGAEQEKKPLCHATGDPANPWVVIAVAEPAWPEHFGHGDRPFDGCCQDADCAAGQTCGPDGRCTDLCAGVVCGDDCHVSACDPTTGQCSAPVPGDHGTPCADGNPSCAANGTCCTAPDHELRNGGCFSPCTTAADCGCGFCQDGLCTRFEGGPPCGYLGCPQGQMCLGFCWAPC